MTCIIVIGLPIAAHNLTARPNCSRLVFWRLVGTAGRFNYLPEHRERLSQSCQSAPFRPITVRRRITNAQCRSKRAGGIDVRQSPGTLRGDTSW